MNVVFAIEYQDGDSDGVRLRLAANVRRLRVAARISLSQLARVTGMSKATLSGIEQGRANPTVDTLAAVARALDVEVEELLKGTEPTEIKIVRATEWGAAAPEHGELRRLDSIQQAGAAELFELRLPARQAIERSPYAAGSHSHVFVLQGTVIAGPTDRISELGDGDYASFPADVPHVYEAVRHPARALVLMTGPAPG